MNVIEVQDLVLKRIGHELMDQVGANKTTAASDENFHNSGS